MISTQSKREIPQPGTSEINWHVANGRRLRAEFIALSAKRVATRAQTWACATVRRSLAHLHRGGHGPRWQMTAGRR